jgi:hypothetical protein
VSRLSELTTLNKLQSDHIVEGEVLFPQRSVN